MRARRDGAPLPRCPPRALRCPATRRTGASVSSCAKLSLLSRHDSYDRSSTYHTADAPLNPVRSAWAS
ncbi:hypothetical protein MTO96_005856 [Rhipicephalus appendiculatus]